MNYKFAVIHFNVGLHGLGLRPRKNIGHFPKLLAVIRHECLPGEADLGHSARRCGRLAPNLREFHPNNGRVKARNKIVAEPGRPEGIPR